MTKPHSSPQVISFLESLREEFPEEFEKETPARRKRQELKDIDVQLAQLAIIEREQMFAPREQPNDEWTDVQPIKLEDK